MNITSDQIRKRVKHIRKIKQRSIHDCARILEISEEQYSQFEKGSKTLSLPQIEILAFFLEIQPEVIFNTSNLNDDSFSIINNQKTQQFINLRNKIIRTQLAIEREKKSISIENIHHSTNIPIEILQAYDENAVPIPVNHLVLISNQLSMPINALILNDYDSVNHNETTVEQMQWQVEYSEGQEEQEEKENHLYQQLIKAIKYIPERDQAEIAKIVLEKLKTESQNQNSKIQL